MEVKPIVVRPVVVDLHVEGGRVLPQLRVTERLLESAVDCACHQVQDLRRDRLTNAKDLGAVRSPVCSLGIGDYGIAAASH